MDVSLDNFIPEVIEASQNTLILVDFWAPWCAPCRALTPVLEKLEQVYAGKIKLVKINTEENPELAAKFQVRSIPFVVAFYQGKPINAFNGALPEAKIREFIEQCLPNPLEVLFAEVDEAFAKQDFANAESSLKKILHHDANQDEARVMLIDLLLQQQRAEDAATHFDLLDPQTQQHPQVAERKQFIEQLRAQAANDPTLIALEQQSKANPDDLNLRLSFANALRDKQKYAEALEQLIYIVEVDRNFQDDIARKTMLDIFNQASEHPQIVSSYRRKLSMLLF